jgi:histidine triad (HIT) family protein
MPPTEENCPFCQIIRGEAQSYIIFEDDVSLAFLDRRPLFPGHCLLTPKAHYPTLLDLPTGIVGPLFTNAQLLAQAVEQGLSAEGTFVAINNRISQSVPHLHIHIVPRRKKDGLKGFFWPRQKYESEAALLEIQQKLRSAVSKIVTPYSSPNS